VDDIDEAVDELAERGVRFERYDDSAQDEKGIYHGGAPLDRVVQGSCRQRSVRNPARLSGPDEKSENRILRASASLW
jgi:hypothetical protein